MSNDQMISLSDEPTVVTNNLEHIAYIRDFVRKYKLVNGKINKPYQLLNILLKTNEFIYIKEKVGKKTINTCFAYNVNSKLYEFADDYVRKMLVELNDICDYNSFRSIHQEIMFALNSISNDGTYKLQKANLPPSYIIRLKNGYLNLKTNEFFDFKNAPQQIKDYHFIREIPINYKNKEELNPVSVSIAKRLFDDWSNNTEDVKYYLYQILFSCLEGRGHKIVHVFRSQGGDGKSSYINICSKFAGGLDYTIEANINEFDDDNLINQIGYDTALIAGDDLPSNANMSGKRLARFKSLVSGQSIQANVKFQDNISVKAKGVFIQATNSDFQTYENTPAVADRLIINDWPNLNYRKNPITDFDLDTLLDTNDDLYSAILFDVINTVTYFEKYTIPLASLDNSNIMLRESDLVFQFVLELNECGLLQFERLPEKVLYNAYVYWLKENNSGSKPLSATKFAKRVIDHLETFGFSYEKENNEPIRKRIQRLEGKNRLSFNLDIFESRLGYNLNTELDKQSRCFINKNNQIVENEIEEIRTKINTEKEISDTLHDKLQNEIIIYYLVHIDIDPDIIAYID